MLSQLSGASRLFPIIGDPVEYAQSPVNLTRTFAERGHNGLCVPLQVRDGDLDVVMAGLTASLNVDGILVTMPHKFTSFAFCTSSSERARLLGVVSVIRRNPDRTWHGNMLDGLAFVKAQQDSGAEIHGASGDVLGGLHRHELMCFRFRSSACPAVASPRSGAIWRGSSGCVSSTATPSAPLTPGYGPSAAPNWVTRAPASVNSFTWSPWIV